MTINSFFPNTKQRTTTPEIMDNFAMTGDLLKKTLDQIAAINHYLGGNKITLDGLKVFLKKTTKDHPIKIVDLGCGNGDMLRAVAKFGRKHNWQFELIGIDANEFTVNYARSQSTAFPEIKYLHQDIFADAFDNLSYDIVLSTLFLHHFTDEEILLLLEKISKKATIGLIINDLHRSPIAYFLFQFLRPFITKMAKEDGLTSILRGFKKSELQQFSKKLAFNNSSIQWRWAFRFLWLVTHLSSKKKIKL